MRILGIFWLAVPLFLYGAEPFAVVKSVKGHPHYRKLGKTDASDLVRALILPKGVRLETGEKERVILRLFSGEADLEVRSASSVELLYKKIEKKPRPVIHLVAGEALVRLSKEAGKTYVLETLNTHVTPGESRWLAKYSPDGVTKLILVKGKLMVFNRPKGTSAMVREGQTCYSDENGIRIGEADQEDLNEFRVNYIEVDFIHSQTEETKTLQVEYETDF